MVQVSRGLALMLAVVEESLIVEKEGAFCEIMLEILNWGPLQEYEQRLFPLKLLLLYKPLVFEIQLCAETEPPGSVYSGLSVNRHSKQPGCQLLEILPDA